MRGEPDGPGGAFVAVIGPSGSGKSTLLNLIAGLDRPSSGTVVVDGVDLATLGEAALARFRRRRIGFVFQFFNLLGSLTVADNIRLPAQLAGVKPRVATQRVHELLDQLDLVGVADYFPARPAHSSSLLYDVSGVVVVVLRNHVLPNCYESPRPPGRTVRSSTRSPAAPLPPRPAGSGRSVVRNVTETVAGHTGT